MADSPGAARSGRKPFRLAAVVFGGAAFLLLAGLLIGLLLPSDWEAERQVRIEASPDEIFPYLQSADGWAEWTPMPETGVEPEAGEEAPASGWSWDDPTYGEGRFTVVEAHPPESLRYRVEVEGGALTTEGLLRLEPTNGATRVIWSERGDFGRNPMMGYLAGRMSEAQSEQMARSLERLRRAAEGDGERESGSGDPG